MKGALYKGEKVYSSERDWHELLGNGTAVHSCGDVRLLSRTPPPAGHNRREYSAAFEDSFETIPRSEWSARLKEQLEKRARVSDFETWPALDQNGTPQCIPPGTLILMADGSRKAVEDVKVLDMVRTAEGNVGRVVNVMARFAREPMLRLVAPERSSLRATGEHPILTKRGYVKMSEVTAGDTVYTHPRSSEFGLCRDVQAIESQEFEGWVYNLSVEGDNSYVAEGVGVHNCWSNGVAGAAATCRVMQGLPYTQLSPASIAIPISGGVSGGFEGDAVRYGKEHGWAPSSLVPQHSTNRSLMSDPKVIESRKHFMLLEVFDLGDSFDKLMTAMMLGMPCVAAFSGWSHVTEVCDGVEIESGAFAIRIRNSWSNQWGGKNINQQGGYAVFPEHGPPHGRPVGIFALRQLTSDPAKAYTEVA